MKRKYLAIITFMILSVLLEACGSGARSDIVEEAYGEEEETDSLNSADADEDKSFLVENNVLEQEEEVEEDIQEVLYVTNTFSSAQENRKRFAVGYDHIALLQDDGTVIAAENSGDKHYEGEDEVDDWSDIIELEACDNVTVGLKSDGTLVVYTPVR